jgi:hypothetical protein
MRAARSIRAAPPMPAPMPIFALLDRPPEFVGEGLGDGIEVLIGTTDDGRDDGEAVTVVEIVDNDDGNEAETEVVVDTEMENDDEIVVAKSVSLYLIQMAPSAIGILLLNSKVCVPPTAVPSPTYATVSITVGASVETQYVETPGPTTGAAVATL